MAKRKRNGCLGCLTVLVLAACGGYLYAKTALAPLPAGESRYVRFDPGVPLPKALERLEREGVVRNAWVSGLYARAKFKNNPVRTGTYSLRPGLEIDALLAELQKPIRQMVRLPETNWAARNAALLEKAEVCDADAYLALVRDPQRFQEAVDFPLPKSGSLEGYLYPDTYDLPPLLGAEGVIVRQLQAFQDKVLGGKEAPKDLHRDVVVASMVELEVMRDPERPVVAGVIENRLKLGMPLQIDACLLYGIQKWRTLTFADYRNIDSPYNVYRNKGLPPGPICSPTAKSIRAAQSPATHKYLYYVALPDGRSLFSATYDEHLRNIARRKAALAAIERTKAQ